MFERVVVYEDVTGGRFAELNRYLLPEADLMVSALTRDLSDAALVGEVVLLRDARLVCDGWADGVRVIAVSPGDADAVLARELEAADAFWPIAPEEDARLEILCAMKPRGCRLLNSAPEAVRVAAGKEATAECLSRAGVACIPTWREPKEDTEGPYIVKPDKGAGGAGLVRVDTLDEAREAMRGGSDMVVQPYVRGAAMSLSLACAQGRASVLSVNEQLPDGSGRLRAIAVACRAADAGLNALAERIAAALPGLAAYVGVDFIEAEGGEPVVVEINPRLTTSYAGIREACGFNPAQRCMEFVLGRVAAWDAPIAPSPVEVACSLGT